ncbi:cupin [Candidatus Woesebacteria bacterium RIFOXYC1_FULL_43_18]|nr:MAG: cupin [Candidatus Woesebacteria bacterium RIFOXYC1_FULL_43_18]
MAGYKGNLEKDTLENTFFRHVIYTAPHSQLVLMSLAPGEEIGMEVHTDNDQFLRFEEGDWEAVISDEKFTGTSGDCIIVPAGNYHNVINTSKEKDLKLYTVYSPAHHPDGTIHKTKKEAMEGEKNE